MTILASVWQRFVVADRSMEPALVAGDRLLGHRSRRPLTRGEVVVIPHPLREDFWLVKRVIGLPGERVTVDSGQVLVDGVSNADSWGTGSTMPEGDWTPGDNEIFVLSDNRLSTRDDSRSFGPISAKTAFRVLRLRLWLRGSHP